jgi:nitroimidazol reductase NimA-like FMN-containing flavoprotein (pyridoxamine 5'-phosphate oxidase superfamily)
MPRESIGMTPQEVDEFLGSRVHAVLATVGADGAPDVTIVPCRYDDGILVVTVEPDDRARAALDIDDRVCCGFETSPDYYEIRGVSLHGRIEPSDGPERRVTVNHTTSFDFSKIRDRSR